ncbi:hypothetical protein D5F01_LYC22763 [Larimichthys crocea]|uniref:Uncharacterized protein n=1 Tax=Larimichthys crocea TaxID=215358 RepID=A0A6G0HJF3_LARCR|nr:hypothetical protein D5F01_LYC22763 [Larimichthys crocea]
MGSPTAKRATRKRRHEQDVSTRAQDIEKKERELDNLLRALEGKQKELSCHGQDLQKKVKGLKDQGRELKDREYYLRNEEQGLLNWKSELQMRNEYVNSTTQELDELGRDLALLKEELCNKEKNLKESLKKMSKWEQNLKEREERLQRGKRDMEIQHEVDAFDLAVAVESSEDDQEVSERRGKGRGGNAKDGEDQRMKTPPSAVESNNCHPETLKEIEMAGEQEAVRGTGVETKEISRDLQFLSASHMSSNNKESPGSDLSGGGVRGVMVV